MLVSSVANVKTTLKVFFPHLENQTDILQPEFVHLLEGGVFEARPLHLMHLGQLFKSVLAEVFGFPRSIFSFICLLLCLFRDARLLVCSTILLL